MKWALEFNALCMNDLVTQLFEMLPHNRNFHNHSFAGI